MSEVESIIAVDYHFPTRGTTTTTTATSILATARGVEDSCHFDPSFMPGLTDTHYIHSDAMATLTTEKHPSSSLTQAHSTMTATIGATTHTNSANASAGNDSGRSPGWSETEPASGPVSLSATSPAHPGTTASESRSSPALPLPPMKRKSNMNEDLFYAQSQEAHLKQSYKHIAPLPSLHQAYYERKSSADTTREELSSPVPVARSSLFPVTPTSSSMLEPSSPLFKTSLLSPAPSFDSRANGPGSESTSSDLETCPHSPVRGASKSLGRIPLEDVMALREFLRQVDLRHYGFQAKEERSKSLATPSNQHGSSGMDSLFNPKASPASVYPSLRDDSYYNTEDDMEMPSTKLTPRSSYSSSTRIPPSPTSSQASLNSPLAAKLKAARKTSSPLPSSHSASASASAVHVPYRGKHGPNPVCASCRTTKTPYWRDAWHQGILLCNACGLRFAKFKRRCTSCHYVPRKDDKGNRCCPLCKGSWTQ